ncbi:ATP-grasp domain-containing protein [Enterovibrio coralii]|uniref:ATP-grasp domain-containing protein n=1 Tax=Enterovibrio coralii TaxID=294935 RepID=A0A135I8Z3_9GAMM|nr:hypothetical protein [Enterovibrio coralii]KXF81854.1 hypothetical protein ATN88_20380 [Enterovibrio coralii]
MSDYWIIGPSTDPVIAKVNEYSDPERFIDTWLIEDWKFHVSPEGHAHVTLSDGRDFHLKNSDNYYCRIVDVGRIAGENESNDLDLMSTNKGLQIWLSSIKGRVINPPADIIHNGSKPLHEAELIKLGFNVADTFTSMNKANLAAFAREHPVVAKTICGVRARCRRVFADDLLSDSYSGPVHLQKFISGVNVRVHVLDELCHALEIAGRHIDYRHVDESNPILDGRQIALPEHLEQQLVAAAKKLGMLLSGWDFIVDDDGKWWCLEVNPMPAFTPFDRPTDFQLTKALVEYLKQ